MLYVYKVKNLVNTNTYKVFDNVNFMLSLG